MLFVLVQSPIFISDLHQLVESFKPFSRKVAFNYPFLLGLEPIEHVVLFKPVLGRATMVGFHKSHYLLILQLPLFILCHNQEYERSKIVMQRFIKKGRYFVITEEPSPCYTDLDRHLLSDYLSVLV